MPKASEDLRRIAAQMGGITATSSPLILRLLRHRGYDLVAATEHLIGLSNTLSAPLGANLDHREKAQKALPCQSFRIPRYRLEVILETAL
jgi:hypothetical protein